MHFTGSDWSHEGFFTESNNLRLGFISYSQEVASVALKMVQVFFDQNDWELSKSIHEAEDNYEPEATDNTLEKK